VPSISLPGLITLDGPLLLARAGLSLCGLHLLPHFKPSLPTLFFTWLVLVYSKLKKEQKKEDPAGTFLPIDF
jgi:hypothetical protein